MVGDSFSGLRQPNYVLLGITMSKPHLQTWKTETNRNYNLVKDKTLINNDKGALVTSFKQKSFHLYAQIFTHAQTHNQPTSPTLQIASLLCP